MPNHFNWIGSPAKIVSSALLIVGLTLINPTPANAAAVLLFEETGGDVAGSLSGSIDLTGLTLTNTTLAGVAQINPSAGLLLTGTGGSIIPVIQMGVAGPASFGSGVTTSATSSDATPLHLAFAKLYLPGSYTSGSALGGTMTFASTTLSALGIVPGVYVYTLGNDDTLTVQFDSATPVPLPAALPLFAGGLGLMGWFARRKRRQDAYASDKQRWHMGACAGAFLSAAKMGRVQRFSKLILAAVALAGFGLSNAQSVDAATVAYHFEGALTSVHPVLKETFGVGDTITGTFTYDPAAPLEPCCTNTFTALLSVSFQTDGYSASSSTPSPIFLHDEDAAGGGDEFRIISRPSWGLTGPDVGELALYEFVLSFRDSSGDVFATALTLPSVLNLSFFDSTFFEISFFGPDVRGSLTSLTPVPLPAALPLFAGGLGLLGWLARQKRRQAAHA